MLKRLKLKTRMILVLGMVSALQTAIIGGFAWYYLSASLDEQIGQRALMVAKTIAAMPEVIDGVEQGRIEALNRLSQRLTDTNEALFIVIGDHKGIRLAHPNPARLGLSMADDDGDDGATALVDGQGYINKALGSLGLSMRGKAPIFDMQGQAIIGIVSVGYSLNQVRATIARYNLVLYLVMTVMLIFSVAVAIFIAERFKRAIFGLEPEQIARLFEERDATLQSVREGIIAVNREGIITTINRTAIDSLRLDAATAHSGRPIAEVLPDSGLMAALERGAPEFDQEIWLQGQHMIVNRLPVKQGNAIIGVVSSFRLRNELDQVSRQLTRIQQYADTLRSQTHEYSNKLHTIAGLIQIGASDKALHLIGSEVQDHQSLIHLLLDAVQDPVLAGCILGKYNRAREMGQMLVVDPDSHMTDVPAQLPSDQLVSALGNLIDNALEATRRQQGEGGKVYLSMTDLGLDLIFEVEDQGPGISAEEQARMFEKGFTCKAGSGHGIGLYLVSQFVERWGGTITAETLPSAHKGIAGSRFTLYLPKQPTHPTGACP